MAERSVSVKLTASTAQYQAAMKQAAAASKLPGQEISKLSTVGSQLQSVGGSMTRYVTVPLAGLGVAATKMASDFEGAFANMAGLADAPIDQIDSLRDSVLSLAGETGQAPMALADALYSAMSSGLDAAQAMEAVDIAAHGAAAGLGSSADIVSLVASATTSYGAANLDAAQAVDILTQTIREGRADPDELAGTLGRILPVAAELGISFDQVGAATAYLSNVFGDTNRTVTAMSGLMLKMLSPTQQGRKALEQYGLSVDQLHRAIDRDGLLGALELLRTSGLAGNSQALRAVFDDVEAFQGITALLGADVSTLEGIFANVANSTGAMGEAFAIVAETDGFKMKQALAEIQVAMIKVGDVLLPIAAQIGSAIADLVSWFSELPGPVQDVVVAVGGLAAAAGPVLMMTGSLLKGMDRLGPAMRRIGGSGGALASVAGGLGVLATAAGVAYAAWQILGEGVVGVAHSVEGETSRLGEALIRALDISDEANAAGEDLDRMELAYRSLGEAVRDGLDEPTRNALDLLGVSAEETLLVMEQVSTGIEGQAALAAEFFDMAEDEATAFIELLHGDDYGIEQIAQAFNLGEDAVRQFSDAMFQMGNFAAEGQEELAAFTRTFLEEIGNGNRGLRDMISEIENDWGLQLEVGNDAIDIYSILVQRLAAMTPAQREAVGVTDEMVEAMTGLEVAAAPTAEAVEDVGEAATEMAEMVDTASIDVRTSAQRMADSAQEFEDSWIDAIDGFLTAGMGLYDAEQQLWDVAQGFSDAIDDTSRSLATNSVQGRQNADALQEWARAIADHTQEMIDSGASAVDVANDYHHNREALLDNAEALGFNREEVESLLREWGLMPSLVSTTYQMAGIQTARDQVQLMLDEIGEIPPEVATEIQALVDQGKYDEAIAMLFALQNPIDVPVRPYLTRTMVYAQGVVSTSGDRVSMRMAARGAYLDQPEVLMAGEAGPEVILPLTDKKRMAELLGMPQVGPAVWAAMSSMSSLAPVPAASQVSHSSTYDMPIHVTVADQSQIAVEVRRQVEAALFRASHGTARSR